MKKKKIILILINLFIIINVAINTYIGIKYGSGEGQVGMNMNGINYLRAFTVESNIFAGITSILNTIYLFKNNKKLFPKYVSILQYISACVLGITFIVVAIYLGPIMIKKTGSYFTAFSKDMLFFHLLNPIFVIYLFLSNKEEPFTNKELLISLIPITIYGIAYFLGTVVLKSWYDIYGFLFNGRYYITIIVVIIIFVVYYLLAKGLQKIHNKK